MIESNSKKFIILQEDDKGFNFKSKKPSGYTKIESKDEKFKIFYYIQNINNENTYGLNLIVKNDSKVDIISIGECKADSSGKIDISFDFEESMLENICGSSVCVKSIGGEVKFPLSGFLPKKRVFNWKISNSRLIKTKLLRKDNHSFDKKKDNNVIKVEEGNEKLTDIKKENDFVDEDNIKNNFIEENQDLKDKDLVNETNKNDREDLIEKQIDVNESRFELDFYKREEKVKQFGDTFQKNIYDKYEENAKKVINVYKDGVEHAKKHVDALKKLLIKDDGKIEKMLKSLLPKVYSKTRGEISDYDYKFFLNMMQDYDQILSLSCDGYVFFKIYVDDFSQMKNMKKHDSVKYAVIYYPMIFMYPYFKDKGYFIVGLNYDKGNNISNIVYGVEVDEGMETIFPYDGKTGFNKYIYDYEKSKGYHIMEYDYKEFVIR